MDSLTQITLGACVAAAAVPPGQRRKAAGLGAFLGTLPDLDVFLNYGGPVENFTMHRGFSHSLFVLTGFGTLLWLVLQRWWKPVREHPRPWLAAILLALLTHPLLDAHTAYGTQLFWPIPSPPVAWATLFIIDPLYTLPLLFGLIAVLIRPASKIAGRFLATGLVVSTLYLGWSWIAQGVVAHHARQSLAAQGLAAPRMFITPSPLNTLLWRVVARTENGYFEGFDSLVADDGPIRFTFHPSDDQALVAASADIPAAGRLQWFADGFVSANVSDGILIITDLRMGAGDNYVFRHAVAQYGNPRWQPIPAQRLPMLSRSGLLSATWERIWSAEPKL
jgi:inner membrane protein